jgi:copper chaperone
MTTETYAVSGMTCAHCELSVQEELLELAGVRTVTVDRSTGLVTVTSAEPLDRPLVDAAVEEAGYTLS